MKLAPLAGSFVLAVSTAVGAQPPVDWVERVPETRPSDRNDIAAAFDTRRGRYVMFGGILRGQRSGNDETWELDGLTWTRRNPSNRPAARIQSAMAYDPAASRCLLFGGNEWLNGQVGRLFADTWSWDGVDWTLLQPNNSPPVRAEHCLEYDPVRGAFVLFGGGTGTSNFADTWEFVNGDWVQRQPNNSPSPRCCTAMAFDPVRGRMVLFGGYFGVAGQILGDTWEWDGVDWRQVQTANAPGARAEHAMAWDPNLAAIVLYGGSSLGATFRDTWTYDGVDWTPLQSGSVGFRWGMDMEYDSARDRIVLVGGQGLNGIGLFGALDVPTIRVTGSACPGTAGTPAVTCEAPWIGNPAVTASVRFAGPNRPVAFGFATSTGQAAFGPCTLYLAGPTVLLGATSSALGIAQADFSLPYDPALRGAQLYLQGFVFDPGAAIGIASTRLATLVLGD